MNIIVGIMKSGNHALQLAMSLCGAATTIVHDPYGSVDAASNRVLYVVRNPRNVIVSAVRFAGLVPNEQTIGDMIRSFSGDGSPFADYAAKFSGYHTDPNICVVKYERMLTNEAELQRAAQFVGGTYITGLMAQLPYLPTVTRNDHPTIWSDYWTQTLEDLWLTTGAAQEALWQSS